MKIHFLKNLPQFVDYLCSLGDEGINILRNDIIQIIEEIYRDKNLLNAELKTLLFDNFIKIAKSIIPKEKDNYILDLVLSFGYESNETMEFLIEHKKLGIKFISKLSDVFGKDITENYLLPQLWFFAEDENEEIKKEVLLCLPCICNILSVDFIGNKIYNLTKKLSKSKSWIIRKTCIEVLPQIIKIYKDKLNLLKNNNVNNIDIEKYYTVIKNFVVLLEKFTLDKDKNVRHILIKHIGEIISSLEKNELSFRLLDFYKESVNEYYFNKERINPNTSTNKTQKKEDEKSEEDYNYYFAYNFPAILYCYGGENWDKLNKIYASLCNEKDPTIRRSIIASFHEVSNIVGQKITEEELLPIYENFLNSKDRFEKNFAIKNLPKILAHVSKELKDKYLRYFDAVSIFQQNMTSKVRNFNFINWRNKIDVIEGILCYYNLYDNDIIYKSIIPQSINFCLDDVYKVRSASCKILANLISYLYNENYKKNELFNLLEVYAFNKKYHQRVSFAKMCKFFLKNNKKINEEK